MTLTIKDLRVQITPQQIRKYRGVNGIDRLWLPYDRSQNIYDLRMIATDKSSVPGERKFNEDVDARIDDFKEISSRMRDSPLYVKSFDKRTCAAYFHADENDHALDSIDEIRSNAMKMQNNQIQWVDKS